MESIDEAERVHMKAVTWQAKRSVSVDSVPDPVIKESTDAIVRITSTNICGSDLHLYETLTAFMEPGDILGHEPIGVVEEVGKDVTAIKAGDRVVIPFQMSCGHCFMCHEKLFSQCETTQVKEHGTGAALFGFSKLYGEVPGGQADACASLRRRPRTSRCRKRPTDDRFVFLSDILPTAWQAVEYAAIPKGGTLVVLGLGPIGDMASRIAQHHGARVIAVDLVPERLQRARDRGTDVIDLTSHKARTWLRSSVTVPPGVGPTPSLMRWGWRRMVRRRPSLSARALPAMLPDAVGAPLSKKAGIDRLAALFSAIDIVRRGGTISVIGVYGGAATDPLPLVTMFRQADNNFGWVRRTSCGGSTTSSRYSWTKTL